MRHDLINTGSIGFAGDERNSVELDEGCFVPIESMQDQEFVVQFRKKKLRANIDNNKSVFKCSVSGRFRCFEIAL